jgi:hypothetical protein
VYIKGVEDVLPIYSPHPSEWEIDFVLNFKGGRVDDLKFPLRQDETVS